MKILLPLLLSVSLFLSACSVSNDNKPSPGFKSNSAPNIILSSDFTDPKNHIGEIFDFFDVSVRTERGNPLGTPAHFGRRKQVNTVRMLGGWRNQDLSGDTYQWNGEKYIYNFESATQRIDAWLNNNWDIFQIVLDNPPWAFQRGYKFVEKADGNHYLAKDRIGVYGNGLPPNDAQAWNRYIQNFISHLVEKYGKQKVLSWRFRVGSEIDTRPQHWAGTRQQFFEHYKNTVEAVHSILPTAQIGVHFREGSFKSRYMDYKGNKENSYAVPFIEWAKQNNVHYNFIAVSYYPHITKTHELDLDHVYDHDMAPIHQHPDFNPNASFEIHEFKFISKMLKAGFVSVATSHASAFFAMLSKMMLEKDIREVFQWGNQNGGNYSADAMTQLALSTMVGNQHFISQAIGKSHVKHNQIAGIFSQSLEQSKYDILVYNFNKNNFNYQTPESIRVAFNTKQPIGTSFKYRIGKINRFNNIDDQFYAEFAQAYQLEKDGGWQIKETHKTASTNKLINEKGQAIFKQHRAKYGKANKLAWSEWQSARVIDDGNGNAVVWVDTSIESFGVQKLEVQFYIN